MCQVVVKYLASICQVLLSSTLVKYLSSACQVFVKYLPRLLQTPEGCIRQVFAKYFCRVCVKLLPSICQVLLSSISVKCLSSISVKYLSSVVTWWGYLEVK